MPNGAVLESVAGVIDTTWEGIEGRIKLIIPKDSSILNTVDVLVPGSNSSYVGDLIVIGNYNIDIQFNSNITGLKSENANVIKANGCTSLTNSVIPKAIDVDFANCALTAKSIGDFLIAAYTNNPTATGIADFSGGINADKGAIKAYMEIALDTTITSLGDWITANLATWTITYNG